MKKIYHISKKAEMVAEHLTNIDHVNTHDAIHFTMLNEKAKTGEKLSITEYQEYSSLTKFLQSLYKELLSGENSPHKPIKRKAKRINHLTK